MSPDALQSFCLSLPASSHVVQWGGADVYKVGKPGPKTSKVFAVAGWQKDKDAFAVSVKVSEIGFEALKVAPGCRPAPYLASRGMKWIQVFSLDSMDEAQLFDHIRYSHELVARGLTKALRAELGLLD